MSGTVHISTSAEEFQKSIKENIDLNADADRMKRIIEQYSAKYKIKGEVATFRKKRIHIDYIPTLDAMLEAATKYSSPLEVIGAALYKVEKDHCLYFTDPRDSNLERVYLQHKREANAEAKKLWKLNSDEFDNQLTHATARIFSGAFQAVFGQFYGAWRNSLSSSG